MALTPFRWVALAAIGCMLAILAVVSMVPEGGPPRWYVSRRFTDTTEERLKATASRLNQAGQNLAFRYHMMYLADSVRRVAARAPDTGAVRVFVSEGYSPETRAAIDKTVRDGRSIRRGDAGRADIFIIRDTASSILGARRYWTPTEVRYEIPTRAGDRCRVLVTTGMPEGEVAGAFNSDKSSEQILGPCGLFVVFGDPGPMVRQWLLNGGWQYAIDGSWTAPPFIPEIAEDESIFKGPATAMGMLNIETGGFECIKGGMDACERSMTIRARVKASQAPGLTSAFWMGRRRYYGGTVGYQASEVLSNSVRELGRERFKAFWTSPDSVSIGFQKAAGERWGAFIQRWMIAHYGEVHPGPRMSSYATVTSAILVIVAIGFTMLMSVRRTYT